MLGNIFCNSDGGRLSFGQTRGASRKGSRSNRNCSPKRFRLRTGFPWRRGRSVNPWLFEKEILIIFTTVLLSDSTKIYFYFYWFRRLSSLGTLEKHQNRVDGEIWVACELDRMFVLNTISDVFCWFSQLFFAVFLRVNFLDGHRAGTHADSKTGINCTRPNCC